MLQTTKRPGLARSQSRPHMSSAVLLSKPEVGSCVGPRGTSRQPFSDAPVTSTDSPTGGAGGTHIEEQDTRVDDELEADADATALPARDARLVNGPDDDLGAVGDA